VAKIGGRNTAFAWLVGVVALAVVAGLVWLAAPMVPLVFGWTGQVVDSALNPRPAAASAEPSPTPTATVPPPPEEHRTGAPTACGDLYPRALWDQLKAAKGTSLDESVEFPPSSVSGLPEALGAKVTIGCAWTDAEGTATVTLADVGPSAAATAQNILTVTGFTCTPLDDGIRCELPAGDQSAAETHVLRGGRWLAVVRTFPGPPFDLASAEASVWP
jgi:hypothetical protein